MKKPVRKIFAALLTLVMCFGLVAACSSSEEPAPEPAPAAEPEPAPVVVHEEEPPPPEPEYIDLLREQYGLDENNRFIETRSIRILTFDRDTGTDPQNNHFTNWIKENVLADLNIDVEFYTWRRWGEEEDVVTELAAGTAPDMVMTFNSAAVDQFADQGAVVNLQPYLEGSQDLLPNLWDMLTWEWLYKNQRDTGEIWRIQGVQAFVQRTIPFIREDWCAALGLPLPTTLEEFEACLYAFKENADTLLGSDAGQILPLHMTEDIGWVAMPLIESFIAESITDKEYYMYDIGGPRHYFHPGVKEAIRLLNKWYHDGLFHPDFALFGSGADDTADNAIKSGFVGAVAGHSWDQPYRDGETGWTGMMHAERGDDANFIAINTFKNDAGLYRKYLGGAGDRQIFIPATSTEHVAVLLYLDWLCRSDTMFYLQAGVEGENHVVEPNGAIRMLDVEAGTTYAMANPPRNYDLTPNMNGAHFGDMDLAMKSMALGYSGVDPRLIEIAFEVQNTDCRYLDFGTIGTITAEADIGDAINERSRSAWARAIVAAPEDFDAVYDAEFEILYNEFATASITEREQLWTAKYGDTEWLPTGDGE